MIAAVKQSATGLREVFAAPQVRRLQLAHATSLLALWSFGIASSVYAFGVGGATLVGVVMVLRMVPAAIVSPFAATLGDRYPRRRVLLGTDLIRAPLTAAAAACVALDAAPASVFVITGFLIVVSTAFDPAKNALLPSLVSTPSQLVTANAVGNTLESASIFVGPAIGGALLALTSIETTMAASAGLLVVSGVQLARIRPDDERPTAADPEEEPDPQPALGVAAGLAAVRADGRLRLLLGVISAQTFVDGLLSVLIVVTALDLLDLGQGGVGLLDASVGVGGVLAGFAALSLGTRRLAPVFGVGLLLWGVPIALIGVVPETAAVMLLLAVVGVGNTLIDVSSLTLLQRAVPDQVRARVFGILEGLVWGSIGLGGALAPALIAVLGTRGALVATGLILPLVAALTWTRLRRLDAEFPPEVDALERLAALPLIAPLGPARIEALASQLSRVSVPAGGAVTEQGEPADRFFIIDAGEVEVFEDGVRVRTEGPGDFFGEIGLLQGVPRTATVRALSDLELLALGGEDFVAAVTGHADSSREADAVIAARLGSARRALPTL